MIISKKRPKIVIVMTPQTSLYYWMYVHSISTLFNANKDTRGSSNWECWQGDFSKDSEICSTLPKLNSTTDRTFVSFSVVPLRFCKIKAGACGVRDARIDPRDATNYATSYSSFSSLVFLLFCASSFFAICYAVYIFTKQAFKFI